MADTEKPLPHLPGESRRVRRGDRVVVLPPDPNARVWNGSAK